MYFLLQLLLVTTLLLVVPSACYLLGRRFAPRLCRHLAYELHLWLGIVCGLILFVVCLSGTLLTFKTEIIRYVERDRYVLKSFGAVAPKSIAELIPLIENAENGKVVRVTIPEESNQAWIFNLTRNSEETTPVSGKSRSESSERPRRAEGRRPTGMPMMHERLGSAYLVNPYTGESLGPQRSNVYMFFLGVQFLHRFLLLDIRTGQIIVGSATLIFLVLVVGGLFLWFPPKLRAAKGWFLGLKVRTRSGWGRFLYDMHNTLGFYALGPLVIMALTGPMISFEWYRNASQVVLGTRPFARSYEKPIPSDPSAAQNSLIPVWDDFIARGAEIAPRRGIVKLYLPQSPTEPVTLQVTGAGPCNIAATDKIQFDRYSGAVLKADLFDDLDFGAKIASLIFPLHNGEIFGAVSKWIYFIACLIATSLPLTGVLLWARKLRSRSQARKRNRSDGQSTSEVLDIYSATPTVKKTSRHDRDGKEQREATEPNVPV